MKKQGGGRIINITTSAPSSARRSMPTQLRGGGLAFTKRCPRNTHVNILVIPSASVWCRPVSMKKGGQTGVPVEKLYADLPGNSARARGPGGGGRQVIASSHRARPVCNRASVISMGRSAVL